jgi:hypothetical protein
MIGKLSAAFPPNAIHWRAQSVTKDGTKAMALAYIDARDVMARLDEACGAENWQDSYVECASGRLICTIAIRIGDEWVSKSDGSGDSDIEGEKGAISGAFKRAAVKWGVGRYLYDMPCPWVACEAWQKDDRGQKKWVWSGWKPEGLKELERVAKGNAPSAPIITDNDANAATILTLAKAADVSIQVICETYNVSALDELTDLQAQKIKNRLTATISERKKAANG